jgi:hypothetical protein
VAWVPKVGRHAAVLVEIGGKVKRRPAIITGFAEAPDGNPIFRVGRQDIDPETPGKQYETYGNETTGVPLRTDPNDDLGVGKYVPY